MKNITAREMNERAVNVFHPTPKGWPVEFTDALILFDKSIGSLTVDEIFTHPLVSVKGIKSETKLIGYAIKPHASLFSRSIGGTLFSATNIADVLLPTDVIKIFSGKNFSIFMDDLEQGIVAVATHPKIVDVNK